MFNKHHSASTIEKMKMTRRIISQETRDKMRNAQLGIKHHMYGKKVPQETKDKISESLKRLYATPKGKELRVVIDKKNEGNHHHLGHRNSPEAISRMSKIKTGKVFSETTKQRMSETGKVLWQMPSHRDKLVTASRKALHIFPNKPEKLVLTILNDISPNNWKFVGDGGFIINGRNPDFMNVNSKKQVILLHGIYWHLWRHQKTNPNLTKEQVEISDIEHYKRYGFDVSIIWEDELKDIPQVTEKIATFCNSVHKG